MKKICEIAPLVIKFGTTIKRLKNVVAAKKIERC